MGRKRYTSTRDGRSLERIVKKSLLGRASLGVNFQGRCRYIDTFRKKATAVAFLISRHS